VSVGDSGDIGSKTQYFVGTFDGIIFNNINSPTTTLWLDEGRDNYAGVTFSFPRSFKDSKTTYMAWMSNWRYAEQMPTYPWRGAMTLPRDLSLAMDARGNFIISQKIADDVAEKLLDDESTIVTANDIIVPRGSLEDLSYLLPEEGLQSGLRLQLFLETVDGSDPAFELQFSNDIMEHLSVSDNGSGRVSIDRVVAGVSGNLLFLCNKHLLRELEYRH